jgi:hypothetical protein
MARFSSEGALLVAPLAQAASGKANNNVSGARGWNSIVRADMAAARGRQAANRAGIDWPWWTARRPTRKAQDLAVDSARAGR